MVLECCKLVAKVTLPLYVRLELIRVRAITDQQRVSLLDTHFFHPESLRIWECFPLILLGHAPPSCLRDDVESIQIIEEDEDSAGAPLHDT